jgi:hypothetical protein
MRRKRIRGLLIGLGMLAVIVAALLPDAFTRAEEHWARRPFHAYHLIYSEQRGEGRCIFDLGVQNERIVTASSAPAQVPWACVNVPPRTISDIFQDLRPYHTGRNCGLNGCGCDRLVVDITYDPIWSYPRTATVVQRYALWWQLLGRWLMGRNGCTAIGWMGTSYTITALTPQP